MDLLHSPPWTRGTISSSTGQRRRPFFIVQAGTMPKRRAAERAGYQVKVWIDDMPEMMVG